jgi:flagellar biosynthesis anti-sigma factor FlgM
MPDPIRGVDTTNPVTATSAGQTGSAKAADAGATTAAAPAAPSSGADLADVAQTETLLKTIVDAANNTPGIDQTKVTELQNAISSGSYQANPQSIAQKIVELENLLGTAGEVQ